MKKTFCIILVIVLALSIFTACGKKKELDDSDAGTDPALPTPTDFPQLSDPKAGDKIAVFETSEGTFKAVLYSQYAPLSVENFIALASKEYYKDMIFHRVVAGFVIQTGDPTGTGTGGESATGTPVKNEVSRELHHFYGALGMANAGKDANKSQFYVVTGAPVPNELIPQMEALENDSFPAEIIKEYKKVGGQPTLDNKYTVFGQVYEGMDVVEKIAKVKVDADSRPINDVKLISITIEDFAEPAAKE